MVHLGEIFDEIERKYSPHSQLKDFIKNLKGFRREGEIISLRQFQKDLLENFLDHEIHAVVKCRQSGFSLVAQIYAAYQIIRNGKHIEIVSPRSQSSQTFLKGVKDIINYSGEDFLTVNQKNVLTTLGGGSLMVSTAKVALTRSETDILIVDEMAFIRNVADMLNTCQLVQPQVIIGSTPNGTNLFYDFINALEQESSDHVSYVTWRDVGHDYTWKNNMIKQFGQDAFEQEYENKFI